VLTLAMLALLAQPWLKLAGAVLLLWIAAKLLAPAGGGDDIGAGDSMMSAIGAIVIADLVMSLDNVIAVAAAAKGDITLLIVGLAISIPLVILGANLLAGLMERYPAIIAIGAAVIGFVAGEMAVTDPAIKEWVDANAAWLHSAAPLAGALAVVAVGRWRAARAPALRFTSRKAAPR
jgi:YjbE family integral membrane protein